MSFSPWPGGPQQVGGGGGASASKTPKLQPLDASVVAAWTQEYVPGGTGINAMILRDYSGNGYDGALTDGLLTVPDQVPGRLCSFGWLTNQNSPGNPVQNYSAGGTQRGLQVPSWGPQTEIDGDMTFATTLAQSGQQGAFPAYQYIYSHGADGMGLGTSFAVVLNKGDFRPAIYWDGVGGVGSSIVLFSATLGSLLRTFLWSFVSVVRDATAKTLRVGINGTYETQPYTVLPPTPNAGRYPWIGQPTIVASDLMGFCGPIPNPVIRNATLTDAQLEVIRKHTMGL